MRNEYFSYDAHYAVPNSLIYTRSEVLLAVQVVTQNFTSIQKLAKRKFSIPGEFKSIFISFDASTDLTADLTPF